MESNGTPGHLAEKCGTAAMDAAFVLVVILGIAKFGGWL